MMHDGMPYDPTQGQGHGHEPFKAVKSGHFQQLSHSPFTMGAGN